MRSSRFLDGPIRNWSHAIRDIALSAMAAALSWWTAISLLGDHPPAFAAIAAIVCLSPGVGSHGRQAVGMLSGVGIGIAAGELAHSLPIDPAWRIAFVTPLAMLAGASFGLNAVMVIQAGASAVIVVAGTQVGAGFQRVADAAIGGGVGLLFSQVLFTPDPVAMIERAGARLIDAVGRRDAPQMREAAVALDQAIASARAMVRATVRGRFRAADVARRADHWLRIMKKLAPLPTGIAMTDQEKDLG